MDLLELKTGLYPEDAKLRESLTRIAPVQKDLGDARNEQDWDDIVTAILEARLVICT